MPYAMNESPKLEPQTRGGPANSAPRAVHIASPPVIPSLSRASTWDDNLRVPSWFNRPDPSPAPIVLRKKTFDRLSRDDADSGYYGSVPTSRYSTAASLPGAHPGSQYGGPTSFNHGVYQDSWRAANGPPHPPPPPMSGRTSPLNHISNPPGAPPLQHNAPAVGGNLPSTSNGPFPVGGAPNIHYPFVPAGPGHPGYYGPPPGSVPPPGSYGPMPMGIPPPGYYGPTPWGNPFAYHDYHYPGAIAPPGYRGSISRQFPPSEEPEITKTSVEHILEKSLISERALNHLGLEYFRWDNESFYLDEGITKEWKDRLIALTERLREDERNAPFLKSGANFQSVFDTAQEPKDVTVRLEHDLIDDLEDAVEEFSRLRRIGSFRKAKSFFEVHLRSHLSNPYVLVLWAEMLLDMGDYCALKSLHASHAVLFHLLEGAGGELLTWNWELVHLSAAARRGLLDEQFFEGLHHTVQELEFFIKSRQGHTLGSSEIRIITRLLDLMASQDFDDFDPSHDTDDWLKLYDLLEYLDWATITKQLFSSGSVWEFRDLLTHALPIFGTRLEPMFFGRPIISICDALSKWYTDAPDTSTNLALLDMYSSVLFNLRPKWNSKLYKEVFDNCEKIMSWLKVDPENLSCRMYAERSLLNVIYSALSIRSGGRCVDNLAGPNPDDTPSPMENLLLVTSRDRDVLKMAIALTKELQDYRTLSMCLEIAVLVFGGADRARLIAETVHLNEVVQGVPFTGIDLAAGWPTPSDDQFTFARKEQASDMVENSQEGRRGRQHLGPREQDDHRRLAAGGVPAPQKKRLMARFGPLSAKTASVYPARQADPGDHRGPEKLDYPESEVGSDTIRDVDTRKEENDWAVTSNDSDSEPIEILTGAGPKARRRSAVARKMSKTPSQSLMSADRPSRRRHRSRERADEDRARYPPPGSTSARFQLPTRIRQPGRMVHHIEVRGDLPGPELSDRTSLRDSDYLSKLESLHKARSATLDTEPGPSEGLRRAPSQERSTRSGQHTPQALSRRSTQDISGRRGDAPPFAEPVRRHRGVSTLAAEATGGILPTTARDLRSGLITRATRGEQPRKARDHLDLTDSGPQSEGSDEGLEVTEVSSREPTTTAPEAPSIPQPPTLNDQRSHDLEAVRRILHDESGVVNEANNPSHPHKGKDIDRLLHPQLNDWPTQGAIPKNYAFGTEGGKVYTPLRYDSPGPALESSTLTVGQHGDETKSIRSRKASAIGDEFSGRRGDEGLEDGPVQELESPSSVVRYCPP